MSAETKNNRRPRTKEWTGISSPDADSWHSKAGYRFLFACFFLQNWLKIAISQKIHRLLLLIIITIITFKTHNSRFSTISSLHHEPSPARTLKWPRYKGTTQLLSLTELKSHLLELYSIGWTIKPMKEGRKPEYPEKTPGDKLQKMPHNIAQRFKPQAGLEHAQ